LWEKNKTSIILVAPGLYQFAIGFFSAVTESMKVYINGEVII